MAGKPQKPAEQLQGHRPKRQSQELAVDSTPSHRVPPAPRDWHPIAKRAWRQYWLSTLPAVQDKSADDEAIRRLFFCISEREKLEAKIAAQPTITGSTGQVVANPLFMMLRERTREIEKLREAFGLTPLYRMRLGITWNQADEARDQMVKRRSAPAPMVVEVGGDAVRAGDGEVTA